MALLGIFSLLLTGGCCLGKSRGCACVWLVRLHQPHTGTPGRPPNLRIRWRGVPWLLFREEQANRRQKEGRSIVQDSSTVCIEPLQETHLFRVQLLINMHLSTMVPGWGLPETFIARCLH